MLFSRTLMQTFIICLLIGLTSWQVSRYSYDWGLQQLQQKGMEQLLAGIAQLRTTIRQYQDLPFVITQNRDVQQLLKSATQENQIRVNRYLEQISLISGSHALLVINLDGETVASSTWRSPDQKGDQSLLKMLLSRQQSYYFQPATEQTPANYYLSAPIYQEKQRSGLAITRIHIGALQQQQSNAFPLYVTGPDQQILMQPPNNMPTLSWPLSLQQRTLGDNSSITLWIDTQQRQYLLQQVSLDDLNWTLITLSSLQPVRKQAEIAGFTTAGAGLALLLLWLYLRESKLKKDSLAKVQKAEKRLEQQHQDIIDTAQVGLLAIDGMGRVRFINPMARQFFGLSNPLAEQCFIRQLLCDSEQNPALQSTLSRLQQPNLEPLSAIETCGIRSDGSHFPMLFSLRKMHSHPDTHYLVTIIDISRRKALEEALQQANEQLEAKVEARTQELQSTQEALLQSGKLAALGRMSTVVVHELNQPLTAMKTYLAIAKRQLERSQLAPLSDNLSQLNDLTERMEQITSQLKIFAYKKPDHLTSVPLADTLQRVLQLFRSRFESLSLAPHCEGFDQEIIITGDRARLEQVLINLISNACDAMSQQSAPHQLLISAGIQQQQLIMTIQDNGPGIDPAYLPRLFEPFFTTREMGTGLGLGLAIVHSIIQDLNGTITADNHPEGGALFTLTLPLHTE